MQAFRLFRVRPIALVAIGIAALSTSSGVLAQSGRFTYVTGNVQVQTPGGLFQARVGTEVNPNDVIITGDDGMAQLTMVDQARLSLRSRSRLPFRRKM